MMGLTFLLTNRRENIHGRGVEVGGKIVSCVTT
jgi:hypothetical protein